MLMASGRSDHDAGGGGAYEDPGEHVERVVDAQVDAREGDEEAGDQERRGEGRVDVRERQGSRRRGRGVAGGEGARGWRLYEGGYLGVVDKGPGAVEEVLRALGERPGCHDGDPGHEQVRGMQTSNEERPGGDETPERSRGPRDREGAHHGRQWRPLVTEDGPEQRPVEVPYFAREILQARIAGYCTRLRPGCPSKGSGQENHFVPPRDK